MPSSDSGGFEVSSSIIGHIRYICHTGNPVSYQTIMMPPSRHRRHLQVCKAPTAEATGATGATGSAQLRKPAASAPTFDAQAQAPAPASVQPAATTPARQIDARASPAPIVAAAPAQAFIFMLVISIKSLSESHYAQHVPTTSDSICPQATVVPAASTATAPQAHAEFKVRDIKAEIFKSHDEVTSTTWICLDR